MTTPPPPWGAHPPTDAPPPMDDEDTGPIRAVGSGMDEKTADVPRFEHRPAAPADLGWGHVHQPAARLEDSYAARFTAPLTVEPRAKPLRRRGVHPGVVAGAAVGVVLAAVATWLLWPSGESSPTAASTAAPTPTIDAEAQERLTGLLPAGYPTTACKPVEAPEGVVAEVNCTKNSDGGGPTSATYTLTEDVGALKAALDDVVADATVVNCPGNIQSPGPWRRNATPESPAGTLVCGMSNDAPLVAWTTDADLMLNVVRAGPEGPTLDQLYTWWSSHS